MSTRTVPPELLDIHTLVRAAIVGRKQLVLMYGGMRREVCPHSLGWKGDHLACFAFQFGGLSRQPMPAGGQWRCLHLHQMSRIELRDGPWHTGPIDPQSSSCIDEFDAYVGYPQGELPEDADPPLPPEVVAALLPLAQSMDQLIMGQVEQALEPLRARIVSLERAMARLADDEPPSEAS